MINKQYIEIFSIVLIVTIYILSGVNKIFKFKNTAENIHTLPIFNVLPFYIAQLGLSLVIILWILGSILLLYSKFKNVILLGKILSILFVVFTLIITLYYHNPIHKNQQIDFMKNLAIMGGFISIYSSFME
uniref:Methylamine utilisation protein MauE domain-containing protein n=1 Tax=Megaviridae environmental sample TaxID=1737588 RepID=A0A5J6VKL5_9VIRU|nr:MAG: hypothetical protein [Megaviridae environmental sample]